MEFPRNADDVGTLMGDLNKLVGDITVAQQKSLALTATATGLDGRITISVNARGIVTEVLVDDDTLTQVTGRTLGAAITTTTQKAAAEVDQKMAEVWAPINARQNALPSAKDAFGGLAQFFDGLPDIDNLFTSSPQPPLTPPGHPAPEATNDDVYYEHVEDRDEPTSGSVQDRAW